MKFVRRSFITLLTLGLLIGWGLGGWAIYLIVLSIFEVRVANKDSTIQNLETQVAGYESKLDVSTPSQAEEKFRELQNVIVDLQLKMKEVTEQKSKIVESEQIIIENADGTVNIQESVVVVGAYLPNGLIVEIFSDNIIEGVIYSHNTTSDLSNLPPGPHDNEAVWSRMIPSPYGQYTITIVTKGSREADFRYRFSVPKISDG